MNDFPPKAPHAIRDRVYQLVDPLNLFSDTDGTAYMNFWQSNGAESWAETYAIKTTAGRSLLIRMYVDAFGMPPSSQGLKEGIDALEAQALRTTIPVGLRTAPHKEGFAFDLADKRYRRVIVTPGDWNITHETQPVFRRGAGVQPLPEPISGGNILKLRDFINIDDDDSWALILGWLVYALQPKGPYPILALQGEQGSCKSTIARMLTALIDPNEAPLIPLPKSERDLMVVAKSRRVLAFDNVSSISPDTKDALCRLATGSGYAGRKLYSDSETVVWKACRPIILNGIENYLVADDLADRAISITLPYLPEDRRVRESDLIRDFDRARFEILGALLDAAACALEAPTPSKAVQLPRMADFAHFAASAAIAWRSSYGQFLEIYKHNRTNAVERSLDTDPLARALSSLLEEARLWEGTYGELHTTLRDRAVSQDARDALPQKPRGLSARLRRLSPALRAIGITVTDLERSNRGYLVRLVREAPGTSAHDEHREHSPLLNIEEEKRKRETYKSNGRSQRSPRSPADDSPADKRMP